MVKQISTKVMGQKSEENKDFKPSKTFKRRMRRVASFFDEAKDELS